MKIALPLLLFGYTLVYAGVAAAGQFADNPWLGLTGDAYETAQRAAAKSGGATGLPARILHDVFGIAMHSPVGPLVSLGKWIGSLFG